MVGAAKRLLHMATITMSDVVSSPSTAVMTSRINPVTGKSEWIVQDEDYDFIQEIARSGYADMLHDKERNVAFRQALASVVGSVKASGKEAHILDIGTGTGLLSMLAARIGADSVTACEAFRPMAIMAQKVIDHNGLSDRIKLISERSTDIGEDNHVERRRGNICVAEVFDTELIGEGALRTFKEAHAHLLEPGARIIPSAAIVYALPIQSATVLKWDKPHPIVIPGTPINLTPPPTCVNCYGTGAVHDVQLDQIPQDAFIPVTDSAIPVFRFNFEDSASIHYDASTVHSAAVASTSKAHRVDAVLMWWTLDMDGTGKILLSTEPNWLRDKPSEWRDHWMQAIYYLPKSLKLTTDDDVTSFTLHASHDEHSLWFSASLDRDDGSGKRLEADRKRPVCECGLHAICSRSNLGRLNDTVPYAKWANALSGEIENKTCLCISDCSLLPLIAAQMGAKRVFSVESQGIAASIIEEYVMANDLSHRVRMLRKAPCDLTLDDIEDCNIDYVLGDPFFFSSMLPWENVTFWYVIDQLRKDGIVGQEAKILPQRLELKCMALDLDHLWKIRAPVGTVEGCDISKFDEVLLKAIGKADGRVEPHPLWEYPGTALSSPTLLGSFDLTKPIPDASSKSTTTTALCGQGSLNGVAIWVDWSLGNNSWMSTGLREECDVTNRPTWNWYHRQGVYFMEQPFRHVAAAAGDADSLKLKATTLFDPSSGVFGFDFEISK